MLASARYGHQIVMVSLIMVSLVACTEPNPDFTDGGITNDGSLLTDGEVNAGEESAGEESAGEVSAGEVSAGEVSAGEVSAGEVGAGEVSAGEVNAGEVVAGEVVAGEVSAGEVSGGSVTCEDPQDCDGDGTVTEEDCNDEDLRYLGAPELCDGVTIAVTERSMRSYQVVTLGQMVPLALVFAKRVYSAAWKKDLVHVSLK